MSIAGDKNELEKLAEKFGREEVQKLAFPESFLRDIAIQFELDDFDLLQREVHIASRAYIYARLDGDYVSGKESKDSYKRLIGQLEELLSNLKNFSGGYITDQMFWGAKRNGDPILEQFERLDLRDPVGCGEEHFDRLIELLEFLKSGCVDHRAELFALDRGGPRLNFGLQNFIGNIFGYWTIPLERRFTLDHHKGVGLTPAFDFVKALVTRIEAISDAQIMTAMRSEIRRNRTLNNSLEDLQGVIDSGFC